MKEVQTCHRACPGHTKQAAALQRSSPRLHECMPSTALGSKTYTHTTAQQNTAQRSAAQHSSPSLRLGAFTLAASAAWMSSGSSSARPNRCRSSGLTTHTCGVRHANTSGVRKRWGAKATCAHMLDARRKHAQRAQLRLDAHASPATPSTPAWCRALGPAAPHSAHTKGCRVQQV